MQNKYKDHSYVNALTHSAVYRASPSPNKRFKRPSSKYSQTDQISSFELNGSFCSPQTAKKGYLRNTVDVNKSSPSSSALAVEAYKKCDKIEDFQALGKAEKSPFKAINSNQKIVKTFDSKNKESSAQNKSTAASKPNFQTQQPLFNKIIKKIDDKQKLLTQLKKIAETQLPTRLKKSNNHQKASMNLNLTIDQKSLNHPSLLSLSYVATRNYQENSLKQKYLNIFVSHQGQSVKNPQKQKQMQPKKSYFTPKNPKHPGVQNEIKQISASAITSSKYSTPQNTKKNMNQTSNPMKKKSTNAFEIHSNSIKELIKSPFSQISSFQSPKMSKPYSQQAKLTEFKIMRNLGEGKFGTVFEVIHKETNYMFALKRISKQMIKSHLMTQQLALQIRIQSFCSHNNIVKLYATFDDSTYLYLLLEYMEEGTLFNYLKKQKTLREEEAAVKVKQVAQAVKYLHQYGIAHRDIKPQNIVLSNGVAKLCDFGWAAICNERRRTYCGTFDYAAPQILEGSEYDMSVDMWCIGVLAYELLVGKAPFYHISRKQTMKKIMNVSPASIQFPANLTKNAVDFIKKLLIKQPEERMNANAVLKHPFLSQLTQ